MAQGINLAAKYSDQLNQAFLRKSVIQSNVNNDFSLRESVPFTSTLLLLSLWVTTSVPVYGDMVSRQNSRMTFRLSFCLRTSPSQ